MDNYGSVDEHVEAVGAQFVKDQSQGWMVHCPLEEAKLRWPGRLRIAALGAIEEKPGSKEIRVIYDGTHRVLSNHEIRVRDQLAFPMSTDMQPILHQMALSALVWFALIYDFASAPRLVPVREADWGGGTKRAI